jgi:hypothetical protein
MEAIIFVCGIICILTGYVAARIEFNKKLSSIKDEHFEAGVTRGFNDAAKDLDFIRRCYLYHFGNLK